tara:strand:+ start:288 stop:503 length:216 start_codon:yes stop_codon:yes gene_type:complete
MSNTEAAIHNLHSSLINTIGFDPVSNIQIEREYGADVLADMNRAVALGIAKSRVVSTNSYGLLIIQYRLMF